MNFCENLSLKIYFYVLICVTIKLNKVKTGIVKYYRDWKHCCIVEAIV